MNDQMTDFQRNAKMADLAEELESHAISPRFQMVLVIITTLCLCGIMYQSFYQFSISDSYPPVTSLTPKQLFEIGGPPTRVEVGINVRHFSDFDIVKGKFTADLSVWFRFNPEHIPVAEISKFVFEKAEVKNQSKPFIKIQDKNFILHYDMNVEFSIPMNYSRFPIDDHRLAFIVDNYFVSPSQVYFESSKAAMDVGNEVHIEGWNLSDYEVQVGYFKSVIKGNESQKSMYHPRVIFLFDFEQTGIRYLVAIFLPLLMIFFLSLFSFSGLTVFSSIDMSAGAIAALIGFRFVMESSSPQTGYFMTSDYIFLYLLSVAVLVLLLNMFGNRISLNQKKLIAIVLHAMTIGVFYYLLVWGV